jgi:hypothetical protein
MEPGYADGWVNVARARIQEEIWPEQAETLANAWDKSQPGQEPFLPRVNTEIAGRYDEALNHLRVASGQIPRDRVVLNTIGRVLFLQRKYG